MCLVVVSRPTNRIRGFAFLIPLVIHGVSRKGVVQITGGFTIHLVKTFFCSAFCRVELRQVRDCDIFCCLHDQMHEISCYCTRLVYATVGYVETLGVDFISFSNSNSHCHFSHIYKQSRYQILLKKSYERSGRGGWDLKKKRPLMQETDAA